MVKKENSLRCWSFWLKKVEEQEKTITSFRLPDIHTIAKSNANAVNSAVRWVGQRGLGHAWWKEFAIFCDTFWIVKLGHVCTCQNPLNLWNLRTLMLSRLSVMLLNHLLQSHTAPNLVVCMRFLNCYLDCTRFGWCCVRIVHGELLYSLPRSAGTQAWCNRTDHVDRPSEKKAEWKRQLKSMGRITR